MKRLGVILTILALTTAMAVWSLFWLAECTDRISDRLSAVLTLSENDPVSALEEILDIQAYWDRTEPKIGLFVHEELLLDVSEQLSDCVLLLQNDNSEEFRFQVQRSIYAVRNLLHQQLPTLENIF
ncbi:MAG: DUF4363 family protein [Candidatus Merdivicinus sp.]|jgi:hypothetical protein